MKLILSVLALCFAVTAGAHQNVGQLSNSEAREILKQRIKDASGDEKRAMEEFYNSVNKQPKLRLMSTTPAPSDVVTELACLYGSAGFFAKGLAGVCVDTNKNVYTMYGAGAGISIGAKGTLVAGIVKSPTSDIRGTYYAGSIGQASSVILTLLRLGRYLKTGIVGVDVVVGFQKLGGNGITNAPVILLGGIGLGPMIDLSASAIVVR